LEFPVEVAEDLGAGLDDRRSDSRPHFGGCRAFSRREGENVHLGEGDFPGKGERFVELGIGLTGEADDHIGRDRGAVQAGPDQGDLGAEVVRCVGSHHPVEDGVRAGLER